MSNPQQVLEALHELVVPCTHAQLQSATGISAATLRVVLTTLFQEGKVERPSRGHYVLSDSGRSHLASGVSAVLTPIDHQVLDCVALYGSDFMLEYCRTHAVDPKTVSPRLARLVALGLIRHLGGPVWRLTPEGVNTVNEEEFRKHPWLRQYEADEADWRQRGNQLAQQLLESGWERADILSEVTRQLGPRPLRTAYEERSGGEEGGEES